MGRKRFTAVVDDTSYDLLQMSGDQAPLVRRTLGKALGHAMTEVLCTINVKSIDELFDGEVTPKMLASVGTAMAQVFEHLTGPDYIFVRNAVLEGMMVNGKVVRSEVLPEMFAGRLLHCDKLVIEALRGNFADFFAFGRSALGQPDETGKAEAAA